MQGSIELQGKLGALRLFVCLLALGAHLSVPLLHAGHLSDCCGHGHCAAPQPDLPVLSAATAHDADACALCQSIAQTAAAVLAAAPAVLAAAEAHSLSPLVYLSHTSCASVRSAAARGPPSAA